MEVESWIWDCEDSYLEGRRSVWPEALVSVSAFDLTMNVTKIFPVFWQSGCPQTMQLLGEGSFVIRMVANIAMTLYSCLGPCSLDCIHHLP